MQAQVLGLWGMGGIGMTTLAKALFNDLLPHLEGSACFLADVRDRAGQPRRLIDMQVQLLKTLGAAHAEVHDEDAGAIQLEFMVDQIMGNAKAMLECFFCNSSAVS